MADEDKPAEAAQAPADAADKKADDSGKPVMMVRVYAPFEEYFKGEAYSLTAVNETGPFDILPRHHNFLCMLLPCEILVKTPYEEKKIKISRALLHVRSDKVTVFVDV